MTTAIGQASKSPRCHRRHDGRVVAGVCSGLADHFGLDPVVVRLAFVVLAVANGLGVLAYLAFWVLLPRATEQEKPAGLVAGAVGRRDLTQLVAFGALSLGVVVLLPMFDVVPGLLTWPVVLGGLGGAILWQQADPERRERWLEATGRHTRSTWVRSIAGAALVMVGMVGAVVVQGDLADFRAAIVATLTVIVGLAVITGPWWVRLTRTVERERRERIRSQEHAELAAHIHDSVLHTLTLIQRSSDDPREVQRLARSQERALRTWLYQPKGNDGQALAAAIERVAAEAEEAHGIPIEVVCVGDCGVDDGVGAALQAAREAMVNAAKHAGSPSISVYAEVEPGQVEIFVRDRGKGFDMGEMPTDRMGVRQSIVGRMERNGGSARVRTSPGEGTEVQLRMVRA